MVQETQTGIGITQLTTLETIEAIGTSSFKIREWRQTTDRFTRGCAATGNVSGYLPNAWTTPEIKSSNLTITEQMGKQWFSIKNGGICVPMAGSYQLMLHRWWWTGSIASTIIIKSWGNVVYTKTFSWAAKQETVMIPVDLGKFETIELRWQFTWSGSWAITMTFSTTPELTLQQL